MGQFLGIFSLSPVSQAATVQLAQVNIIFSSPICFLSESSSEADVDRFADLL